jgi:hypothetical protein
VPAELHANRIQWLIRLCVIRGYVSVMWRPGVHRFVWLRCQVRTHCLMINGVCVAAELRTVCEHCACAATQAQSLSVR